MSATSGEDHRTVSWSIGQGQPAGHAVDLHATAPSGMVPSGASPPLPPSAWLTSADQGQDRQRGLGLIVVVVGLVAIVAAFVVAVLHYTKSADVSTALAPVTGVVGTIVGAYFGVHVGSQGTAATEAKRTQADNQAKALAALASPEDALRILGTQ
jgi:hypothetical protein